MKLQAWRAPFVVLIAGITLGGCRSGETPRIKDSSRIPSPSGAPPAAPRATALAWDADLGRAFAIPDPTARQVLLIDPSFTASASLDSLALDPATWTGASFDLFSNGERIGAAAISGMHLNPGTTCTGWPVAELSIDSTSRATPTPWSVAIPLGRAEAVAFDSLPGLTESDSLNLTIAIARAASTLNDDTSGTFQGRPFIVRQANRFQLSPDHDGILAEVIRTVNQEANPVQEQLLLVLEGEWRRPDSTLRVVYRTRAVGLEEDITSIELLVVLRNRRTGIYSLLVRREGTSGWALELIEQATAGRWVLRWKSALSDC